MALFIMTWPGGDTVVVSAEHSDDAWELCQTSRIDKGPPGVATCVEVPSNVAVVASVRPLGPIVPQGGDPDDPGYDVDGAYCHSPGGG